MKREKINYPLDISTYYGEASGRLAPILWFFALEGALLLSYFWFLYLFIPLRWYIVIFVLTTARIALLTLGDEIARKAAYVKKLYGMYNSIVDYMDNKDIHEEGFIGYDNSTIAYNLYFANRGSENSLVKSNALYNILRKFAEYRMDIRIYNGEGEDLLYSRYESVKMFQNEEAAGDFIKLIDHNREYVKEHTIVSDIYVTIYGQIQEHETLKKMIESVLNSSDAKVFRKAKLVESVEDFNKLLAHDFDTFVDIDEARAAKYAKGEYYGSKVIAYDSELVTEEFEEKEERGFIQDEA